MKRVHSLRVALGAALVICAPAGVARADVNVLTQHNDAARSGANAQEQMLTVAAVKKKNKFGKLWTLFTDGQIVAQPLYVSKLAVAGKGTFNAVIVATMHNTIYVYDADKKPTQPQSQDALIWAQWLSDPQPENHGFDSWNTNFPEYGVLSTPVIDDAHTTMYVVTWHRDGGGQFRLHAIDLAKAPFAGGGFPPPNYRDKIPPAVITAHVPKPGGGQLALDTTQQKQRAALLLSGGVLYVGFATNRETDNTMHGWLLAYDAATLQQLAVWNTTPTTHNGGIWQAGSGPAADADGNVYVMTGNGPLDADHGGQSYGDSVVKLKLEAGALTVKDYFTPCNQVLLDKACGNGAEACDLDLGSAGPMLLPGASPGSSLLIGGGKDGTTYVLDTANLGHFLAPAVAPTMSCVSTNAVQTVLGGKQGGPGVVGNIHGSHVAWTGPDQTRVFVWGEDDNLRSFKLTAGKLATPPAKSLYKVPDGMPGGMLSVSANGTKAGTGILWALVPLAGDANSQRGVRAQLLAFDASNIRTDIWRSEPLDASFGANSVGLFAKFAPPTIANGKVFVPTYGDHENPPGIAQYPDARTPPIGSIPKNFYLAVYGLRP